MTSPTDCWPTFLSHDPRRLIRFLIDAFGFRELVVYGDGERVDHAELATPGGRGGVMLGSTREGEDRGIADAGQISMYVAVPDVDELFARATAAGATVVEKPCDTAHGSRECTLRDPEGARGSSAPIRGPRWTAAPRRPSRPRTLQRLFLGMTGVGLRH